MAEIYRAKTFDNNGLPHMVAVKRVLAHLAEDDDFIQMIVDEAKIASVLRHPGIARVYEFARAHGEYFIAMEYVDGKDMRTVLERCRQKKRPVPPEHAAHIAAEIASGLHTAHSAVDQRGRPLRIIHRDVSPSNIIVSYAGEVKLCDFGIAKATLSQVTTKTGVIKGKVKYMSPEQALGRKLDHRSDVFSLGSCIYEMLTRVPPFTASNEPDLLIKVRDAKYRPIAELAPGTPAELEAIADRCLTRSRANRYQTAAEVEIDLRGFLRKYMPNYSRSNLGRYVRKMFAQEIERELRMLEEYVLADDVSDDVGENLIAGNDDFQPAVVPFQPKPTSTHIPLGYPNGFAVAEESQIAPRPMAFHDPSIHEAHTMILDLRGRPRQPGPAPAAARAPLPMDPLGAPRPRLAPIELEDIEVLDDSDLEAELELEDEDLPHAGPGPHHAKADGLRIAGVESPQRQAAPAHDLADYELEDDLHSAPTQIIDLDRLRGRG
jgi:eukaryotic-like serine/threonine-protein kinase